ncbi:hypothetical protein BDW74DRAFT_188072 [Aspergillus multicolor]|uniref:sugar porter family MFS transporter n=1 Tax=Aspergillus multicolor TaxID=41759 RepID=UPI003CCDF6C2
MVKARTVGSAVFIALGGFLFGYELGIISSTIAQPHFIAYFSEPSDALDGAIVSCFTGGAIIGTLVVSFLNDYLGRKWTLFIGASITTFGCALQAGAISMAMLIAGRSIAGVAVGIMTSTIPMFCSEIAPANVRGAMAGLLQWMLSWGFLVAQWLGYGCTFAASSFQWRFPLAFQCLPSLILGIGIYWLTESPRWLLEKERYEEGKKVIALLHGTGQNDDLLDLEYREICAAIQAEKSANHNTWRILFTSPTIRKRVLLGCGAQFFCQTSGLNVINYYGPRIYESLNINTQTSLMIIGISGTLSLLYTTAALALIDRVGRVKPLIVGALGCAAAMLINAVLNRFFPAGSENHHALRAEVAMNFVIQFFFVALGVISWVYPSEIFPTEVRAKGNALSTFTNWSVGLVFAQVSPIALAEVEFNYFYVFFVLNLVAAVVFSAFYPETKGLTLEEMDGLFGADSPNDLGSSKAVEVAA